MSLGRHRCTTQGAHDDPVGTHTSPSLATRRPGLAPAFELKFLLDLDAARNVEAEFAREFTLDPHGDPALGGDYRVASTYCDSPDWSVFHRLGTHRFRKYRIRRYGDDDAIQLERKTRRGMQVRKRRVTVDGQFLSSWPAAPLPPARTSRGPLGHPWSACEFAREVGRLRLAPTVWIAYRRRAFGALLEGKPARCTVDHSLLAGCSDTWLPREPSSAKPLLPGQAVLELKWRGPLPARFKAIIAALDVPPGGMSKYRHCVQALGLVAPPPGGGTECGSRTSRGCGDAGGTEHV